MKNITFQKSLFIRAITLAITASTLTACFHEDEESACSPSKADHYAVVSTQAPDFSSGDISIISFDNFCSDNKNVGSLSDTAISTYGEDFYHIGRYKQDNVTKYNINSPENNLWQYSANGTGEESSNPYKLVIKDENTGYLIRYGQPTIWIVDPSATDETSFKTGEIDLADYAGDDGIPEAADALIIDDKLYVLMQNQDRDNPDYWRPGIAHLAIYDTANDNQEVDTNADDNTPNGIILTIRNPTKMEYLSSNNTIYVSGVGLYAKSYTNPPTPAEYTGGIESVDITTFDTNLIVDDGDSDAHPYGQISNIAVLNSTRSYFVGYAESKDTSIYNFNPTTGIVDTTPLLANKDISDIEIGPLGDLWIANRSESGITVISTVDNTVSHKIIDTDLLPNDIEFISIEN